MMKTMPASKKDVKPMLFYKTLYFLNFYYCVHEIHTAYNFISCHHMYGISAKSDDIFDYESKAKLRQIVLAHPLCHVCFRHMHHIWYNSDRSKTSLVIYLILCMKNCSRLSFYLLFTELFYLF